jgi:hypothetical protein
MNPAVVAAIETELQKVEDDINADLPNAATPARLMEGMANSSVMAGKGIGSDYASGMNVFLIGAGVGVGADLEENKDADSDISGAGLQAGLIIGTSLKWMDTQRILGLDTNKMSIYFNFFKYDIERDLGDTNARLDLTSFGVHGSYDWIKKRGSKMFGWGGVKFHVGYEYNKTDLTFNSRISESMTASQGGDTYSASIVANPFASIFVKTHSVPIEVSSSIQFLYILSLYGGLGMDFNAGSAKGAGNLNSSTTDVTCAGATCSPGPGDVGDIETDANIDGQGKVNPNFYRGFAGLQIHLPYIRIYGQIDKAFGNDLIAASTGIRFVY